MKRTIRSIISSLLIACLIVSIANLNSRIYADENKQYIGTLANTGKDNGYSGNKKIDIDDPHYGWELGRFYLTGYTQSTTDTDSNPVFLKNVGDKVELRFELLQDIDKLNGDKNLIIYADRNGYDQYFGTQKFNDCRGLLIIRKTDYNNSTEDPIIYENYLDGVKKGADTSVELCEEGDYEVALDYEIEETEYGVDWNSLVGVPFYTNYRISFTFKVRNGNCMVFPFDTQTGSELTNESFTENGFYLDLAKSRYLEINVVKSVYTEGANGYTEDIRFNKPASDGAKYEEEGIYTITVKNLFTKAETEKVIYVGQDPIMKAFVVSNYSPDEIKSKLQEGYTIADDGQLIPPVNEEEVAETTIVSDEVNKDTADDKTPEKNDTRAERNEKGKRSSSSVSAVIGIVSIVVVVLIIAGAAIAFIILSKKKRTVSEETATALQNLKDNDNVQPINDEDSKSDVESEDSSVDEEHDVENETSTGEETQIDSEKNSEDEEG